MRLNKYLCPGICSILKTFQWILMQQWERTQCGMRAQVTPTPIPHTTFCLPRASTKGPCSILWPPNILLISLPPYLESENQIGNGAHLVSYKGKSFNSSEAPNREVTCLRPNSDLQESQACWQIQQFLQAEQTQGGDLEGMYFGGWMSITPPIPGQVCPVAHWGQGAIPQCQGWSQTVE